MIELYFKVLYFLLLFSLPYTVFSQEIETAALQFFAREIAPQIDNSTSYFNYVLTDVDTSKFNSYYPHIIKDYLGCKIDPRGLNNDSIKISVQDGLDQIKIVKEKALILVEGANDITEKIKGLRYQRELHYKSQKSGIMWSIDRVLQKLWTTKYNLQVSRAILYGTKYYIKIKLTKRDGEYGMWYFIRMDEKLKVVDWCEERWIA